MSVKGLILLIALVALGLSITAVVGGGCGSSFGNLCEGPGCPSWDPHDKRRTCEPPTKPDEIDPCNKYALSGRKCSCTFPGPSPIDDDGNGPMEPCSKNSQCKTGLICTTVKARGRDTNKYCVSNRNCILATDKPCTDSSQCCYKNCTGNPGDQIRRCEGLPDDDDDDNLPPLPPIHPPGFGPSHPPGFGPSHPPGRKKGGGMIGGHGSTLGGDDFPPSGFGPPGGNLPGLNKPCNEAAGCAPGLVCKHHRWMKKGQGTCVEKSSGIPISGACGQTNAPCGSSGEEDCCDNLECVKQLGGATCQPTGSGGSGGSDDFPEWAVISLWSAGGVALVAIVIYLIMQMQSGKVN